MRLSIACAVALVSVAIPAAGDPPPAEDQIAGALLPAPPDLREGAAVLGYAPDGRLVTLREGTGDLVCLADDPADERFHSACYHRDLEPFMARGRELRAEGKDRAAVLETRRREIESGEIPWPDGPRALYSITAEPEAVDLETGEVDDPTRVFVLYTPYATEATTGLSPTQMTPGAPWIMSVGEPWSHVMIVQRPEGEDEVSDSKDSSGEEERDRRDETAPADDRPEHDPTADRSTDHGRNWMLASSTERPREVVISGPATREHRWQGEPISLSLRDADLKEVLRSFARLSGTNVVIDPSVEGSVTLELKEVPWDQALAVILKAHGLAAEVDGKVWTVEGRG